MYKPHQVLRPINPPTVEPVYKPQSYIFKRPDEEGKMYDDMMTQMFKEGSDDDEILGFE